MLAPQEWRASGLSGARKTRQKRVTPKKRRANGCLAQAQSIRELGLGDFGSGLQFAQDDFLLDLIEGDIAKQCMGLSFTFHGLAP